MTEEDLWVEEETEWHRSWKRTFPVEWTDRIVTKEGLSHTADVMTPEGRIIKFQHALLSAEEIAKRNLFFGEGLIWLFDFRELYVEDRIVLHEQDYGYSFRWLYPRTSLLRAGEGVRAVFWDFGEHDLFHVKKLHYDPPYGGWGRYISKERWLSVIW